MNQQKGFVLPLVALVILAAVGGGLYYYTKNHPEVSEVGTTSTTTTVYTYYTDTSATSTATTTVGYKTVKKQVVTYVPATAGNALGYTGAGNAALVEVSGQGVMPQRLAWPTVTNIQYNFAISHPASWSATQDVSSITETDGRAVVRAQAFDIAAGTSASAFANMQGASSGLITTKVNAYTALQTNEGANTAYYIVNGAVGYKITVSNNLTAAESDIVRAILVEFTVTKQR